MKLTLTLVDKRQQVKEGSTPHFPKYEHVEFERASVSATGNGAVLGAFLRGLADEIDPAVNLTTSDVAFDAFRSDR